MNTALSRTRAYGSTVMELTGLFSRRRRWWLLPMVAVFLFSSVLLSVVAAIEYVAPFVYTVF